MYTVAEIPRASLSPSALKRDAEEREREFNILYLRIYRLDYFLIGTRAAATSIMHEAIARAPS